MKTKLTASEVRAFLEAANRQFEEGGIYLDRVIFKRNEKGELKLIRLDFEDRNEPDGSQKKGEKK